MEVLALALTDPQLSVRWNAARDLARLGKSALPATAPLRNAVRSSDATTQLWARYALVVICDELDEHLADIVAALDDKAKVWPGMAAAAIGAIGPAAHSAVPQLIRDLIDPNPDNRWSAAGALARIGPDSADAVGPLAGRLKDEDEKVRWYAAWALCELGSVASEAVGPLIEALNDPDDDVRGYAARALGKLGAYAASAESALDKLTGDENPAVSSAATEALELLRHPGAIDTSQAPTGDRALRPMVKLSAGQDDDEVLRLRLGTAEPCSGRTDSA